MIHYYYGDGKGKTTAAMGISVRSLGRGRRVFIVQFLKNTPSGEAMFFESLPNVEVRRGKAGSFAFRMTDEQKQETARIHDDNLRQGCEAVQGGACDLLVLDEVGDAYSLGLLNQQALTDFLDHAPEAVEIVMTGHTPVPALIERADYVTEMRKHKHPYDKGVHARKGVEV